MTTTATVAFMNIAPSRSHQQVHRELCAIAEGCTVVGLVEAIGYPDEILSVPGFRLIRDRSNPSRANVAALVRKGHKVRGIRWWDMRRTWPRTEHGGRHEPRSFLTFLVDTTMVGVYHAPPAVAGDYVQAEGIDALIQHFQPRTGSGVRARLATRRNARPVVIVMDSNDHGGKTQARLAKAIGGQVVGARIDCAVVRNAVPGPATYASTVHGVPLLTDHVGRLAFDVTVPDTYLRKPRTTNH